MLNINYYALIWNPARWTFQDWPQALADYVETGSYVRQWSCRSHHAKPGDRVILIKVGTGLRGVIATGEILSIPFTNKDWRKDGTGLRQYISVRFDRLANFTQGFMLPVGVKDLGYQVYGSGTAIRADKAEAILARFNTYLTAPVVMRSATKRAQHSKRVSLPTSLRYEILDRDYHTCISCGRAAPAVVLHVDHIISQKAWREEFGDLVHDQDVCGMTFAGVNDPLNLATLCQPCNAGKSARVGDLLRIMKARQMRVAA